MKKNYITRFKKYRLFDNFAQPKAVRPLLNRMIHSTSPQIDLPQNGDKKELVILVHGLFHSAAMFRNFATFLTQHGYTVASYDYLTTRKSYLEHGKDFKYYVEKLYKRYPDYKISVISHSMGGILVRLAWSDKSRPLATDKINQIIMLAPPHRGSKVAEYYTKKIPRLSAVLVKSLAGLSCDEKSIVHNLPWAKFPTPPAIVVGLYDRYVTAASSQYPKQSACLEVACGHSYMMYNAQIHQECLHLLENGEFFSDKKS